MREQKHDGQDGTSEIDRLAAVMLPRGGGALLALTSRANRPEISFG